MAEQKDMKEIIRTWRRWLKTHSTNEMVWPLNLWLSANQTSSRTIRMTAHRCVLKTAHFGPCLYVETETLPWWYCGKAQEHRAGIPAAFPLLRGLNTVDRSYKSSTAVMGSLVKQRPGRSPHCEIEYSRVARNFPANTWISDPEGC